MAAWSAAMLITGLPIVASAGIVQEWKVTDGGNGHFYELVIPADFAGSLTWTDANVAAESSSYLGAVGHLVSVTSAEEDNFLRTAFSNQLVEYPGGPGNGPINSAYAWIGLYAPTPTSAFQWTTGESVTYTNWAPSEPNFFGSELWQYTHYWTRDFGSGPSWTWNNEKNDGYAVTSNENRYGYFVEYDGPFTTAAVPEPSTLTIFVAGLLGLLGHRSRSGDRVRRTDSLGLTMR